MGRATSTHYPGCQILFHPPLPPYMRHCRPINQSQADTDRLQLKNRSTREAAHFWKPVTHDISMRHSIFLLSLNFLFSLLARPSMRIYDFSEVFKTWFSFHFKQTFSLRCVSCTHLPTCGLSQLPCYFLYLVSIFFDLCIVPHGLMQWFMYSAV